MNSRQRVLLLALAIGLATLVMVGCGGGTSPLASSQQNSTGPTGMLVVFGTDQPSCDVQSFTVTISSAALVPQGGGTSVTLTPPSQPVDFASLVDFTNILSFGSVTAGKYESLTLTLTGPQLTYLNTSASPPAAVTLPSCSATVTSNCTSFSNGTATDTINLMFSPPLTIPTSTTTTGTTAGFVLDFDMRDSVQTGTNGLITGVVDPQLTATPSTASGTTLGEADTLYGVTATPTTPCTASTTVTNDIGCFSLQVQGGVGQILTVQATSATDFEGDITPTGTGASAVPAALTTAGTFVEVDAIVDIYGNIIAQEVDVEEQVVTTGQHGGFLGKVITVTRDTNGNATAFNLLVGREAWDMTSEVPLQSSLAVTLVDTTHYWSNWHRWNRDSLQFGPQTLGLAENVAVFGVLTAASGSTPVTLTADGVFLRQRNVIGTFQSMLAKGSDNMTGGFTMLPCGDLFGGQPITVLTFGNGNWRGGLSGLSGLTPGPIIDVAGLLFFEQANGPGTPPTWTASPTSPTWVMEAKTVHQLPK